MTGTARTQLADARLYLCTDARRRQGDLAEINQLVDKYLLPYVDLTKTTRLAAGRYWRQATPQQQQQLVQAFKGTHYPSEIRQPILMLAASSDTIVSTAAIEEFAYHLRAGSHLVIAGSKHEILQEQDRYRSQFWAAFDAFVPGSPLFGP